MKLKVRTRTAVVAAGVAYAVLGLATPALADYQCGSTRCAVSKSVYLGFATEHYQGQADNQPDDGAPSWMWVWTDLDGDHVDYYLDGDPNMHKLYAPKLGSNAGELNRNITKFRVRGPNGWGGDACSNWAVLVLE